MRRRFLVALGHAFHVTWPVQDPFRMGYDAVKTALAASKGEQVPAHVDIGASLITKANMNSARSQELLHLKMR